MDWIFSGVASALLGVLNAVWDAIISAIDWWWDALWWLIQAGYTFVYDKFSAFLGDNLEWLPDPALTGQVRDMLEVLNDWAPISEGWAAMTGLIAFEGALLLFKFARAMVWR